MRFEALLRDHYAKGKKNGKDQKCQMFTRQKYEEIVEINVKFNNFKKLNPHLKKRQIISALSCDQKDQYNLR